MIHQVHKNKALTDEALTYMVTSINCYIKMKMSFKQASDPIHFKHKSLRGGGGDVCLRCKQMNNPIPILLMIRIFKQVSEKPMKPTFHTIYVCKTQPAWK